MRTRWQVLSGTGVISIWVAAIIVGQTSIVEGETSSSTSSTPTSTSGVANPDFQHDQNTPYPLGPGAIEYDQLSASDKAAVDHIAETTDTSQPPSSYQAWAAATAWTGQQAQAEVAARGVGLVGTESDGVEP